MCLADFSSTFQNLFEDEGTFIATLSIICGSAVGMIAIIAGTTVRIVAGRSRERTKRELAAYVSEGTLDPDKAIAMINAGRPHWEIGPQRKA